MSGRGKGCDISLRKEKRHSDKLERIVMKTGRLSAALILTASVDSSTSSLCR